MSHARQFQDMRHTQTLLICLESHGAEKRAGTRDSRSGCFTVSVQLIRTLLPSDAWPKFEQHLLSGAALRASRVPSLASQFTCRVKL